MSYISNYGFIILLIVILFLYHYFIVNNNQKNLKQEIHEGFETNSQYKSEYDPQFSPIQLLDSKNLINDRNLLERKLLQWEYPFNGHIFCIDTGMSKAFHNQSNEEIIVHYLEVNNQKIKIH